MFYFNINKEVSIVPLCDGDYCHYHTNKILPEGLELDENTGIISGIVTDIKKCENIEISCTDPKKHTICSSIDLYFGIINI